ncbi:SLBB domain-containing protein [Pseudidiomarina taiwanensis]|uniref:Polysaccharide biosynthesis protein n=1 Tax=Pseudidiomarina taiwanensis TaxID=337250 RepID=A0A432ZK64_9GAMM|nr:SLBB domain-containing protein [Pseudidiomarina taiwanensis]RUO78417.1 polysaccharide biosynthesis protein [Pseudidiomarina taiwanensis]
MKKMALRTLFFLSTALLLQSVALAQVSPAQIEQFKKLPRAQQELLARQYGFDLSLLQGSSQSDALAPQEGQPLVSERPSMNEMSPYSQGQATSKEDDRIKPFGYELFAGQPQSFDTTSFGPVPNDYQLAPGDSLVINYFGKESKQVEAIINREGQIVVDDLPPLNVVGLTFAEAQQLIRNEVSERNIGLEASVSMGELRSMFIYVTGESYKPGAYRVNALTTAMQVLFLSGGVTDIASLRNVQIKRAGKTISELDLYDFLIAGKADGDQVLRDGDVVFIPARKSLVQVKGEVLRPGYYELKGNETIADAIALAGGKLPSAFNAQILVERIRDDRRRAKTITSAQVNTVQALNGDKISVQAVTEDISDGVLLIGAASRTGYYQYQNDLKVTDIITSADADLLPNTDLNYALIVRGGRNNTIESIYQINLQKALSGDSENNLTLEQGDTLVLFSRFEKKTEERLNYRAEISSERDASEASPKSRSVTNSSLVVGIYRQLGLTISEDELAQYAEYSRLRLLAPIFNQLLAQQNSDSQSGWVTVRGDVHKPGVYPLAKNIDANDIIQAAGGLKDSAFTSRSEITREVVSSDSITIQTFDFKPNGTSAPQLQSRDVINVLRTPEWDANVRVTLEGEVRFPGTYTVRRGETLSSVIERAGGLTQYAFARGAVFTREELKELEQQRMQQLAQDLRREVSSNMITDAVNTVSYTEFNQLVNDLIEVEPVGRLVIDLPYILTGSLDADIQLKDGDRLVVPSRRETVNVIGEVQLASAHVFDGALTVTDYIRRAGGLRQKADEERIFVVKANGAVAVDGNRSWFGFANQQRLEPGDTIVVPLDTSFKDNWTLWRDATQILYQTGVAIAAVATL